MKYAVIRINDKQYKVSEGQRLALDRIAEKEGRSFEVKEVLFFSEGKKVLVGQPLLKDVKVTSTVLTQKKAKKIEVRKFKAKSRYRRKKGHRQPISEIKIESISLKEGREKPPANGRQAF